jgi:serine/threonine-protein phosphatase 2A regulatory subunit B'
MLRVQFADHRFLLRQNLSRSKTTDNGNSSNRPNAGGGPVPVPPPKGSTVPANQNYQGSLKNGNNGTTSSPSSSSTSLPRGNSESSSAGFGRSGSSSSYAGGSSSGLASDRRSGSNLADKTSPAPPIVVVSSEIPADPIPHPLHMGSPSSPPPMGALVPSLSGINSNGLGSTSSDLGGPGQPPKAGALNRLRQGMPAGPKDTIPITSKTPPRKQRSSRFHTSEHVEIEKLPNFGGEFCLSNEEG